MDQESKVNPPNFLGTTDQLLNMLPKEAINWLVNNTVKDMTVMETIASIVVDAYLEEADSPILGFDTRMIYAEDKNGIERGTIKKIVDTVERTTRVGRKEMILKNKKPHIYKARCILMGLIRELTPLSIADIGRVFDRDHTSLLYTLRRYEDMLKVDGRFLATVRFIKEDLKQ